MSEVHPITFRLKVFNAWRRGNDAPQPDPKTVGEDIDSICDLAHRLERERDSWKTAHDVMQKLVGDTIKQRDQAREERDQYKGLLIRLHNDLFVHHGGQAVREFKELFREENYN